MDTFAPFGRSALVAYGLDVAAHSLLPCLWRATTQIVYKDRILYKTRYVPVPEKTIVEKSVYVPVYDDPFWNPQADGECVWHGTDSCTCVEWCRFVSVLRVLLERDCTQSNIADRQSRSYFRSHDGV